MKVQKNMSTDVSSTANVEVRDRAEFCSVLLLSMAVTVTWVLSSPRPTLDTARVQVAAAWLESHLTLYSQEATADTSATPITQMRAALALLRVDSSSAPRGAKLDERPVRDASQLLRGARESCESLSSHNSMKLVNVLDTVIELLSSQRSAEEESAACVSLCHF